MLPFEDRPFHGRCSQIESRANSDEVGVPEGGETKLENYAYAKNGISKSNIRSGRLM